MKTPEEMAEEYVAHNRSYPYNPLNAQDRYMRNSYLVGYQAAKPQWISVKERLPSDSVGWVTVYGCILSRWSVQPGFYDKNNNEWVSRFIGRYMDDDGYAPFEDVTHWMPLPEPPKEEK